MTTRTVMKSVLIALYVLHSNANAKILRNNVLINKMVSHFQKDNSLSEGTSQQKQEKVMVLMQNVLCRNFPTIPCEIITSDTTLKKLIEKSIQQINYKKLSLDETTTTPGGYSLTLFPVVNSEELSNFLRVHPVEYAEETKSVNEKDKTLEKKLKQKKKTELKLKKRWPKEKFAKKNRNKKDQMTAVNGRRKLRKFYPHKVKYRKNKNGGEFVNSEENLSISMESPSKGKKPILSFSKMETDDAVWRIDYMKHGEPSITRFGQYGNDPSKSKLIRPGGNYMAQAVRKDILHPDIYIKKNIKKHTVNYASDGVE